MASAVDRIISTESSGNPLARNPRSSAGGLGQFIDSTWLDMIFRHRPDLAKGRSREQILLLKFDPAVSREMTEAYAAENSDFLRQRGIDPTPGNLKLAHFAGPKGAAALYANPDAPVEAVLGADAVRANPFLRGKKGSDVISWASGQMGGAKSPSQAMAANLRQRFAPPKTEGGALPVAGASGQTALAGGAGMDQLKAALGGKSYSPGSIAAYGNLAKVGQDVAGKAQGWEQALLGTVTAGVGGYLGDREGERKKEFEASFAEAAQNVKSPIELGQLLTQHPDEKMRAAGLELLAKNVGQAPQSRVLDGPYGQKIQQDYVDGQWVTQGGGQTGTPNFAAQQPQSAPVAPPAAQPAAMPPSAAPAVPAPSGPMVGGPELVSQNIGEVGASDITPQPAPQAPQQPQLRVGPAVPKAPDGFVHKLAPDGAGYLYGQDGSPVFETKTEADERAKANVKRDVDAPEKRTTQKQVSGNLNDIAKIINDTKPDEWNLAFGRYGGAENATLYENPDVYLVGAAKRAGVSIGEELFGTDGRTSASGLRRKVDVPASDLVMTYRAIQKQRGVTDSQQSNADLTFLENVAGRIKEANSREEAFAILDGQVRPIFERLTGQEIGLPAFKEWKKVKPEAPKPAQAPRPVQAGNSDGWQDYLTGFGY